MEPEVIHHPQVHFVSGDPTDEDVLSRAGIEGAKAAAILSRSDIASSSSADAYSILVAMTVKHRNPKVFTCCEIRNPRNAKHLRLANVDEVVCSVEMGDAVMVQASLNPGLTQLLAQVLHAGGGAAIHRVKPRPEHEGLTVAELLPRLYLEHQCVLVGIDHPGDGAASHVTTSLRPDDVVDHGHHLFVLSDGLPEGFER
jgi:voltage-gated potassium channel